MMEVAEVVAKVGFPIAMALAMAFAIYKAGIVLVNAHCKYLEDSAKSGASLAESFKKMSDGMGQIVRSNQELSDSVESNQNAMSSMMERFVCHHPHSGGGEFRKI